MKKVLLTATAGGHLQELMAIREAFEGLEIIILTDKFPWTLDLENAYLVPRWTGKSFFWLRMVIYGMIASFYAFWIIIRHRPKLIVTTGAEIALPAIFLGKLVGAKSIYIESVTCFEKMSLSARIALPFVTQFYAQQPETVMNNPDKIHYKGNIL